MSALQTMKPYHIGVLICTEIRVEPRDQRSSLCLHAEGWAFLI